MQQVIHPDKLNDFAGRLIASAGRNITWQEIAHRSGVSKTTLSNIRQRKTGGSVDVAMRLANMAAQFGLEVLYTDLLYDQAQSSPAAVEVDGDFPKIALTVSAS